MMYNCFYTVTTKEEGRYVSIEKRISSNDVNYIFDVIDKEGVNIDRTKINVSHTVNFGYCYRNDNSVIITYQIVKNREAA